MKIVLQPTHINDADEGVTVNCHADDGSEVVLFNAVVTRDKAVTLTVVFSTRAWPEDASKAATAKTAQLAAETLCAAFEVTAALL